jgi:cobalt-zinc-cadmium efflux system outer membrane protein
MRLGFHAVVAAYCLVFAVPCAIAQAAQVPLTLQDAISRSLGRNLDLKAFGYELEAQQGRERQAGARPSPEVGVLVENALGTGERRNFDAAETTLSLGVTLERGARERRLDAAHASGALLDTEARIRRLDLAAETARRFVAVLESQREVVELAHATALAQETLKAVQRRVQAAQAPRAEEARALAQLAHAQLDDEHAEHELAAARQRLAALWGETEVDFSEANGDVMSLPPLEPFQSLRARIENSSDLDRLVSEKRLREAEVRLAEVRQHPPWHVTAGVRRFEDDSDHAFIVGLTIPLAVRGQTQGALTVARAQSAQIDAKTTALRVQLDAELFGLFQELRHAYAEVATLRDTVLPSMEAAAEQSRYAYERGRYGYAEWIAVQRELSQLRSALLQACADVHRHRIEIERLTGTALSGRLIP